MAMWSLKAFSVKRALKKQRKEEAKQRKEAIEMAKLELSAQRTELMLTVWDTENPARKREIKQKVVAHRLIHKVHTPCPAEMHNRIPSRAAGREEAGAQMKRCKNILEWSNTPRDEKKGDQKESLFRRFLKSFRRVKTSGSSETTKLPIVNTNQESQQMPLEEPKYMKYHDAASLKTELMGDFFDSFSAEFFLQIYQNHIV
ncbi:uncharacterized protein LOC143926952 [Lithobates pipiens]